MSPQPSAFKPRCIASTGELYQCSAGEGQKREAADQSHSSEAHDPRQGSDGESNFFKSAQWSPDGTCILTNSEDNHLRTFVLPVDLLEKELYDLTPYAMIPSAEPIYSTAIYPGFNLQDPSTTLTLSTPRSHPIRLSSLLSPHPTILSSHPLIHPSTETYITPHSLLWTRCGTHFITGSDSLISVFDISRPGSGPVERHPTIPSKRKKIVGGGVGMKGVVSCLDVANDGDGLLAAGTFTRCVGLYDSEGRGDAVAVFSIAGEQDDDDEGGGITQLLWSPCGRYLYVVERKSDGILVYDVRVVGKKLGFLKGRKALTNQRLGIDVVSTEKGCEIWAGGTDGVVRVWEHGGLMEGVQAPGREWLAHDGGCCLEVDFLVT
ncbi:MAG: hypothetical protein M1827_002463 [Pycnora praestabilis]|nr:MAG: hypothetical protein M1827_002463 [Pycnora praestabilis]